MERLDNPILPYAWGSVDAIPGLLGRPATGQPQAELWMGAHERAASRVRVDGRDVSLLDLVRAAPEEQLGPPWATAARLPFLAKVIAVAEPLSLQVHPDAAHAAVGFAREESRGLPRDSGARSFPDDVAKAELVWAVSPFRALCGFRPAEQAACWLEALDIVALEPSAEALRDRGRAALGSEVARMLTAAEPAEVTAGVAARAAVLADHPRWAESAAVAADLARRYPGDRAVAVALLLKPVTLAPGTAMFVRPGQPHTYLSGTAFEVQANSDNVLRAGLTGKHVDLGLLVDALDTGGDGVGAVAGARHGEELVFAPDTDRFALSVVAEAVGRTPLPTVAGPQVFWALDGAFTLSDGHERIVLTRGQSAYVPAARPAVTVCGEGALLRVTTGRHRRPADNEGEHR